MTSTSYEHPISPRLSRHVSFVDAQLRVGYRVDRVRRARAAAQEASRRAPRQGKTPPPSRSIARPRPHHPHTRWLAGIAALMDTWHMAALMDTWHMAALMDTWHMYARSLMDTCHRCAR